MSAICFITTCMGRLAHLQQTLGSMTAQPGASCIVVDYSCPDHAGDWVEQAYPAVRVVRVTGQSQFRASHARNQGARAASTPWLCFIDADVALDPSFTTSVLPLLRPGHYYKAQPFQKGLFGTFLCARSDFERVGGY